MKNRTIARVNPHATHETRFGALGGPEAGGLERKRAREFPRLFRANNTWMPELVMISTSEGPVRGPS